MNFLSYNRMLVFKNDGHISLVLKMSLPTLTKDNENFFAFSEFYSRLADGVIMAAKSASRNIQKGTRPVTVTLSFDEDSHLSCVTKRLLKKRGGRLTVIKRRVSVSADTGVFRKEFFDVFDAKEKRFLR